MNQNHAFQALQILSDVAADRQTQIQQYPTSILHDSSDEEENSTCPIYDAFYQANGSEGILRMTNFSSNEVEEIYGQIKTFISDNWNVRRGRRFRHSPFDAFL